MPPKKGSGAAATQGKYEKKKTLPEKLEELEKENKFLKLHVAQLEENFDYRKICTKLDITEEHVIHMMQGENANLRARICELESSQISSGVKEAADNKSGALKKLEEQLLQRDKDMQELLKTLDELKEQRNQKDAGLCLLKTKVETFKKENEHLKIQLDEAHIKITNLKTELSSRYVKQIPKGKGDETTSESKRKIQENEFKENDKEINELSKRLGKFESEVKILKDEISKLKSTRARSASRPRNDELKKAHEEIEELKTRSENDERALTIKDRDEQIQQLENTLKVIEKLKDELHTKLEAKETMIAKTKSEKEILKHDLDAAKKENEKCIKDLNSELAAAEGKVKELEKQMKLNQTNYSDQKKEERESLENELKQKDNEINELYKSLRKSESEVESLKDKISKLESTRMRFASRQRNDELKKAHEEIEELKTRLRKAMEITESNPDIADLSDFNRPTKLAERYSELYDNEWTDAFEELENYGMKSRQILDKLYTILKDVYIFSKKVSHDYDRNVSSSALTIPGATEEKPKTQNLNLSTRKQLVYIKKTLAPLLADDVFKLYLKQCKDVNGPKTQKFIGVCTEICWLMSVHDPPVVLDLEEPNGRFDNDRYRYYQRSGKQVDFIVWPPMKLHEKGPLLAKGVAEGK